MTYFLFCSYATGDDPQITTHKRQFFKDLVERIENHPRFNRVAAQTGFLDSEMRMGTVWPDELSRALRTCRVFVYLQEVGYFNFQERPWCGREWHVFQSRLASFHSGLPAGTPRPQLMIPVVWKPHANLPQVAREIQFRHDALGVEYPKIPLESLKVRPEYLGHYSTLLDRLANHIVDIAREHALPDAGALQPFEEIPNPFQRPTEPPPGPAPVPHLKGPSCVEFVYVVARPDEIRAVRQRVDSYDEDLVWRPYFPPHEDSVVKLAEMVAWKRGLKPNRLTLGQNLIQQLQAARAAQRIVVLIVDAWSLRVPAYGAIMNDYGNHNFWNCVVVVPWNEDDETQEQAEALQMLLKETFVDVPPGAIHSEIKSSREFVSKLRSVLAAARKKIEERAKFRRVQGPGPRAKPSFSGV